MKPSSPPFRYWFDPVCLLGMAAYLFGRLWLRPRAAPGTVWHDQFTDFWLIPAALPPMLWLYRRLSLRLHDERPSPGEILFLLIVWSLAAEVAAPQLSSAATGDWRDVAAYALGALLAAGLWRMRRRSSGAVPPAPATPA